MARPCPRTRLPINIDYRQVVPDGPARLTATQVAHRLGVKVETVYAYVSRGYLASERSVDGRTSVFHPGEVDRLARRGRPRRTSRGPTIDVPVETAITEIDGSHVRYRGHDTVDLSRRATYEQVATLLWTGDLPPAPPRWGPGAALPYRPAHGGAVERLRLAVALASLGDGDVPEPSRGDRVDGPDVFGRAGPDLIATMVDALPVVADERPPRLNLGPDGPGAVRDSVAGRLSVRLQERRPVPTVVSMVNVALVLLADHEMAPSTFAVRIAASVRADAAAVVEAGLGTVSGALHGKASRNVRALLDEAAATSAAGTVDRWAAMPMGVPGTGHGLYRLGDPRGAELLGRLRTSGGSARRLRLVEEVLAAIAARDLGRPNVDLALGAMGHVWGMSVDAGEAIFAVARTAGWLAHAAEEYGRRPLRFRTRAAYVGPPPAS